MLSDVWRHAQEWLGLDHVDARALWALFFAFSASVIQVSFILVTHACGRQLFILHLNVESLWKHLYAMEAALIAYAVSQVHYDLWYHSGRQHGARWLRVCRSSSSSANVSAPASGCDVPGLAQIRIDGSLSDMRDKSQQGLSGSGEEAQTADLENTQRVNGSLAPAARAAPALAPARGAAALVRERPQQSVWAPMEYDAMPRWSFMDWMRFHFYRHVWPAASKTCSASAIFLCPTEPISHAMDVSMRQSKQALWIPGRFPIELQCAGTQSRASLSPLLLCAHSKTT